MSSVLLGRTQDQDVYVTDVAVNDVARTNARLIDLHAEITVEHRADVAGSPRWPAALRVIVDVVGLLCGVVVSIGLRGRILDPLAGPVLDVTTGRSLLVVVPAWIVLHLGLLAAAGLYRPRLTRTVLDDMPRITRGIAYGAVADLVIVYSLQLDSPRGLLVVASLAAWMTAVTGRLVSNAISRAVLAAAPGGSPTVIVGSGPLADRAAEAVRCHPEHGLRLVRTLPMLPDAMRTLTGMVERQGVTQVLVAETGVGFEMANALRRCAALGARVSVLAPMPELMVPFGEHDCVGSLPVVHVAGPHPRRIARSLHGVVDRLLAVLLALLTAPLIAACAAVVKMDSRGPAIFVQHRVGLDGRVFRCYKLRTMVTGADDMKAALTSQNEGAGFLFKIQDDPRITRAGRWLRRSSLDELPQLWNVVRGDLSLVGPRPATPDEVRRYPDWFRRRLAVKPGMTGLWQVSGRNDLCFEESVRMDLAYVEGWSPWLDLQILLRTVGVLITRRGAY